MMLQWFFKITSYVCIGSVVIVFIFCKPQSISNHSSVPIAVAGVSIPIDSQLYSDTIQYITGRFDPTNHPSFKEIPILWASRKGMYLRKETLIAFEKMATAAMADGVKLKIISATRNFDAQKTIWENKWTGKTLVEDGKNLSKLSLSDKQKALKILEFSSMPSTSRHHWGTDMDLNNLTNQYFTNGEGKKIYDWLMAHAHTYGFCQPYTAGRPTGYQEEKWHWTYMPIALPLTNFCKNHFRNNMINDFIGHTTAAEIDIVTNYMLGINEKCK